MEYKVIAVSANTEFKMTCELEEKVNEDIRKGWRPLGGVSVSRSDDRIFSRVIMAQAMIKEE